MTKRRNNTVLVDRYLRACKWLEEEADAALSRTNNATTNECRQANHDKRTQYLFVLGVLTDLMD